MKILTLRDNTSGANYTRLGGDPVSIVSGVGSIVSGLFNLFGGEKGITDMENRLQFVADRLIEWDIDTSDIDQAKIDLYLKKPSGWQGLIDNYLLQIREDKKNNPSKYQKINFNTTPNTPTQAGFNLRGLDLQTLLLIGVGFFALTTFLKGKRK